jgi:hypothetical protein
MGGRRLRQIHDPQNLVSDLSVPSGKILYITKNQRLSTPPAMSLELFFYSDPQSAGLTPCQR